MFTAAALTEAFFFTWVVGLTPALVIRYWWRKAPLSNWLATTIAAATSVIFAIGFMVVRVETGGNEGISPAWLLVFLVSRAIMMRRRDLNGLASRLREMIADPATTDERRTLASEKLEKLEAVIARNAPTRRLNLADGRPADAALDRLSQALPPSANEAHDIRATRTMAAPCIADAKTREVPVSPTQPLPALQSAEAILNASPQPIPAADDPFDQFSIAALSAISVFANQQFAAMAARVRYDMRRHPATDIYGDNDHRTLWDEYCFEIRHGPTPALENVWSHTLYQYIASRVVALERPTAVLLTIAAQYATEDLQNQDGGAWSEDLLHDSVRNALHPLADEHR